MAGPYYSDHFSETASSTSIDDPRIKVDGGINHAAVRYKRASITVPDSVTTGEIFHMMSVKSGDRPHALYISCPGFTGTTQPVDIGLYDSDFAVIDVDILGDQVDSPLSDLTTAIERVDVLATATAAMDEEDVGKHFWQIADEGAGTYSVDPFETWNISLTMGTETSVTAGAEVVLELFYTSDGN